MSALNDAILAGVESARRRQETNMPNNRQVDEGGLPVDIEQVEAAQTNGVALRPLREILNDLRQPLPPRLVKHRNQGGQDISYIEWQTAVRYLDAYAPGWSGRVTEVKPINFEVTERANRSDRNSPTVTRRVYAIEVTYSLTIKSSDFSEGVTRESTGFEIITSDRMYGNAAANAEAQAKKRAAAQFGLGLYLYDGDEGTPTTTNNNQQSSTGFDF